ncbi:unnamed protein product [Paramecium sonneborni]|uniref:TLDc domain-containing protein n=1 Tax=Paramecium sonneborni TaxID=65129 RepID=A0A8S1L805_9CILI|nr:unnamed protein product [Paramecium sonneborni]
MLEVKNKYVGSSETFLFTLQPEERKYNPTSGNSDYMMCALDYLAFGSGKSGPAFQIDSELNKGFTYQSDTYDNPLFTEQKNQNRFKCLSIEVYYLK